MLDIIPTKFHHLELKKCRTLNQGSDCRSTHLPDKLDDAFEGMIEDGAFIDGWFAIWKIKAGINLKIKPQKYQPKIVDFIQSDSMTCSSPEEVIGHTITLNPPSHHCYSTV